MNLESGGRALWWTAAAVVVVVGLGLGLGLGLGKTGDDGSAGGGQASSGTTTTLVSASTTSTVADTTTTSEAAVDNGDQSGSAVLEYLLAADELLWEMDDDHRRLLELKDLIEAALPDVPAAISDELETMADELAAVMGALEGLEVPLERQTDHGWLLQAAASMEDWIDAMQSGVRAGRTSGSSGAAQVYLEEGDQARNAFEGAMVEFWMCTAPT